MNQTHFIKYQHFPYPFKNPKWIQVYLVFLTHYFSSPWGYKIHVMFASLHYFNWEYIDISLRNNIRFIINDSSKISACLKLDNLYLIESC